MQPENSVTTDGINYKKKYKTLKRKLRMLIYEQECFTEELRRAQRKLLRISRDKSFLLDRLLQYEKPEQNGSDSEATASSDSETEHQPPSKKKKITIPMGATTNTAEGSTTAGMMTFQQPPKAKSFQKPSQAANLSPMPHVSVSSTQDSSSTKKKVKVQKKQVAKSGMKVSTSLPAQTIIQQSGSASVNLFSKPHIVAVTSPTKQGTIHVATRSLLPGQPAQTIAMTQEELERHLELKQSTKPQFMSIEKTPMLPDNIFSNENSNSCEFPDSKTTDDEDLVIDIP